MEPLARRLPRSFHAFFGRFARLQPVQERALPAVLDGRDVLLSAPTASGKTEAFAAPAAEMVLCGERGGARALFVSPTRALANDLKRRLEGRYDGLGVEFGRYTGEHKERVDGRLPEVTVTTPEGLDSLLARRAHALAKVRSVVCDEIHVLDGTPRGDQLRVLLQRLERAARARPQRIAASATVERPEECAARYLEGARLVCVGGERRIRAKAFGGRGAPDVARHLEVLARHGFRKVLVFCRSRREVEELSSRLKGRCAFGDAVFPHHGSLSRTVRERTESRFLDAPAAVAIATTTLELGIDIGTVDFVLLAGPPSGVSSLLQRIGRGGRRTSATRAGYAVADAGEELVCRLLLRRAARGELLGADYAFRPGILVQQALVLAASEGWVDARRFSAAVPAALWADALPLGPKELLDHLAEEGLLEAPRSGRYVISEHAERRYDSGTLHSNIEDESTEEVVDRLTGEIIGRVAAAGGRRMYLGGAARRIVKRSGGRILTDVAGAAESPTFVPRIGPCCSFAQGRAVVGALGVEPDEIRQVPIEGSTIVLHGLGTVGSLLFGDLVRDEAGAGIVERLSPYVALLARPLERIPRCTAERARELSTLHEESLSKVLAMGPWHRHLPAGLRVQAVARAGALPRVCEFLETARSTFEESVDAEVLGAARCL